MQRNTTQIGHILGVPVFVEISALFLVFFVFAVVPGGLTNKMLAFAAIVITIIGHELGHAISARARGAHSTYIVLGTLGGYCGGIERIAGWQRVIITLAGPAANGVMAVIAYFSLEWIEMSGVVLAPGSFWLLIAGLIHWIFIWNVVLGIFNILPIYPLDGGQAVLGAMTQMLDGARARRITFALSVVGGCAAIALYTGWYANGQISPFMVLIIALLIYQAWRDLA